MTPEKQARVLIDQHLQDAGWIIQDPNAINLVEGAFGLAQFKHHSRLFKEVRNAKEAD